jgi:lipid II:glycine glycyltransferase (peptidoglycan interpeptide bridge formation enzyme)
MENTKEKTLVIDLTQDIETIWRNIKKKRRGDILRAEKRGIAVEMNEHYREFTDIFNNLRRVLDLPPFDTSPEVFKQKIYNNNSLLFVAVLNKEVLAGHWFGLCDGRIRLRYIASKRYDEEKKTIAGLANILLVWYVIKWSKENGFSIYDFGGYAPSGMANGKSIEEINKWKLSFGGKITDKVI